jgi:hypothetical protein
MSCTRSSGWETERELAFDRTWFQGGIMRARDESARRDDGDAGDSSIDRFGATRPSVAVRGNQESQ